MRKLSVVPLTVLMALILGTLVMAQDLLKVTGWVSKIDTQAVSITILPEGGTAVTVIMNDPKSLSKVVESDKAEARYRVQDGKNMGRWLRKITDGGCP
jgi:C4-type Zn-finger protein